VMMQGAGRREKVSVAAALWLPPDRKSLRLSFQTLANQFFDPQYSALFLEALTHEVGGKVIVVWDGGPMHKGGPIREVLEHYSERLSLERLPPYAPQINPVEPVWSWLKHSRLCNYAPKSAVDLEGRVLAGLKQAAQDERLVKGFFLASELPPPRTLLT